VSSAPFSRWLDDAFDEGAASGDDARLVVDVGTLEHQPFAGPGSGEERSTRLGTITRVRAKPHRHKFEMTERPRDESFRRGERHEER